MFAVVAFVFAIGVAFADTVVQSRGWYYVGMGDAEEGDVDGADPDSCSPVNSGSICTISGVNAFDTEAHAIANGSSTSSTALGLLKRP